MKATIISTSVPCMYDEAPNELVNNFKSFSGSMAGICYMKDTYFDSSVSDYEKSLKRFKTVVATGHHSVADHIQVTLLFEEIPKMMAIILNSLQCYATSEKSARYTNMKNLTTEEQNLYDKWKVKFIEMISERTKIKDEKLIEKLAMENARYFISIFTPSTTMSYTTSIRQWNYIYDWCVKFLTDPVEEDKELSAFDKSLRVTVSDLAVIILKSGLYIGELTDIKGRSFDLFVDRGTNSDIRTLFKEEYGLNYTTKYEGSFALLAQEQRHRTLKYKVAYNPNANKFYIPPILLPEESEEWLEDMKSIKDLTPQGALVTIYEMGTLENFILKCKERLCGRAQLEICNQTRRTAINYYNRYLIDYIANQDIKWIIDALYNIRETRYDYTVKPKCANIKCNEPCVFGRANALKRII